MNQSMDMREQSHQSAGGQRGLRLVQQIESIAAEAVFHQRKEAFPVRLLMQGSAAVIVRGANLVDIAGRIVEALGSQKESVFRVGAPRKSQMPV